MLHRICQLLVAEDLRIKIVTEAHLGQMKLRQGCKWPAVVIKPADAVLMPEAQLEESGYIADDSGFSCQAQADIPGPEIDSEFSYTCKILL